MNNSNFEIFLNKLAEKLAKKSFVKMPKRKVTKPKQYIAPNKKEQLTVTQIETDYITEVKRSLFEAKFSKKSLKTETFWFVYTFSSLTNIGLWRKLRKNCCRTMLQSSRRFMAKRSRVETHAAS